VGPGVADPNAGPEPKMFSFRKKFSYLFGKNFCFLLFPSKKSDDLFSHLAYHKNEKCCILKNLSSVKSITSLTTSNFLQISSTPGPYHDTGLTTSIFLQISSTPGPYHAVACRGCWMPGANEVLGCPRKYFLFVPQNF